MQSLACQHPFSIVLPECSTQTAAAVFPASPAKRQGYSTWANKCGQGSTRCCSTLKTSSRVPCRYHPAVGMNRGAALCHLLLHPVISPEQQDDFRPECRSSAKGKHEQWRRLSHRIAHSDRLTVQSRLRVVCSVKLSAQLRQWRVWGRANVAHFQRLDTMLSD